MAFDKNDPADVKIVNDAVAAALATQAEEHEAETEGLVAKRDELLAKLRKARTEGGGGDAAEVERLENELSTVKATLVTTERNLRRVTTELGTITTERDNALVERDSERDFSRGEIVNSRLTAELVGVNVASEFLDDVTASLARQVAVKEVDGKREAFVGDKTLGDFVKEWAGSKGKHYITAPAHGGGGTTPPGTPPSGTKKISEMNTLERNAHYIAIGQVAFEAQHNAEKELGAKK